MLRNFTRLVILSLLIGVLIHMGIMYVRVPQDIPSRFDLNGNVVASMDKGTYFVVFLVTQLGILIGLPLLGMGIKYMPNELINVPNKDYWLSEERRDETLNVAGMVLDLTAIASGLLIAVIMHVSCMAALNPQFESKMWIWASLIGYLAFIASVILFTVFRFRHRSSIESTATLNNSSQN